MYLILCIQDISFSENFELKINKIDIINENIILGLDGKAISKDKDIEIIGEKFKYNKETKVLDVENGTAYIKSNNLKIIFNKLIIDENKSIIQAEGLVNVYDLNNNLFSRSENIVYDKKNNTLSSSSETIFEDNFGNFFKTSKFKYEIIKNILKANDVYVNDIYENEFKIKFATINTSENHLLGQDASVNLNNIFFNKDNEPRFNGKSIEYKNGNTIISEGSFTPCKKNEKCPPWQLTADKIFHDKKKKIIDYENVWLKIYDKPVVYFPKFFHPDPTVKRQSGFLTPTFKSSPNGNTYFSLPYYKVISENRDITFSPRLYAKDQLLIQNEIREVNKNSKSTKDFSIFAENDKSLKGHFFYKYNKNFDGSKKFDNKFEEKNLNINIQHVSNSTYLKGNKLVSPLINNYDLLENSINILLASEDLEIKSEITMFENLGRNNNDKFQYILPKIDLTKELTNKTKLNGNYRIESNNYIYSYDTNVLEKVNINNLKFESNNFTTNRGFYNNYEFLLKNSNTDTKNSSSFKEKENYYLSGIFQFNSSLPLIKKTKNYQSILRPKIALKMSPDNTKNLSNQFVKLNTDNIYNIERISSNDTIEGGLSLTYGNELIFSDSSDFNEILSFKIANNIRLKDNNDLPKNNQLSAKTSNFFGEISYSPNEIFNTKYEFSTLNNMSDLNYENLITQIKFNKIVTSFDYLNENNTTEKNSYLSNQSIYNINTNNNFSFSTRKNIKTNLTEYYNLIYEYKNDCLKASIEYNKDYYNDRDIKPKESVFFKLTFVPFGQASTPNLKK